ncbi:hypothetical protein, partial [Streptomyces sp. NPDC060243]|uniref:hypothetical protein n=1 Tax=Streptomyces sp. NPDC060243 TaxID=3347081 RepID=UPI0036630A91
MTPPGRHRVRAKSAWLPAHHLIEILVVDRHLVQRQMRGRTRRIERLDDLLEGDLRMCEGSQVGCSDVGQKRVERLIGRNLRPQDD